jgi:hypothetical protein
MGLPGQAQNRRLRMKGHGVVSAVFVFKVLVRKMHVWRVWPIHAQQERACPGSAAQGVFARPARFPFLADLRA